MKAVLRDKFITLSYVKYLENSHARNLTAYLKDLEQRNQTFGVDGKKQSNSELKSKKKK